VPLLTVGHGPDDRNRLGARLSGAGITSLVDVRRFPGSRNNPDVRREELAGWLPAAGIAYRWEERLGGRRRLPPDEPVADAWWTVAQFAAYAAHTRTPEFRAALDALLDEAAAATVAVMCSESVWWRCHRRLIADVAVLGRAVPVDHLMPDGRLAAHRPSAGAVVGADGEVRWPA
jgi:uncharacterized protein (DUF488 family)